MDLDGGKSKEDMGGAGGGETITRIYCKRIYFE